MGRFSAGLAAALVVLCAARAPVRAAGEAGGESPVYLDQGWTAEEREWFYYTSQGSQLLPYAWFLALEQKDKPRPFRDQANMERLRFVSAEPSSLNPDGLPVGFVKDEDVTQPLVTKRSFLGQDYDAEHYPSQQAWLGLTCAACHTARIEHGGRQVQIDGGPSLADLQTFLRELADALEATHKDARKMRRFAAAVGRPHQAAAVKSEVAAYAEVLSTLVERNQASHPYGYGRLDAFGAILNAVCETALEIPSNRAAASAPVSYPCLWDTPRLDWVQWNASANLPVARNVGEVLGVFGIFTLKSGDPQRQQFDSTVRLRALIELEQQVEKLKAPAWPSELFGALDPERVRRGHQLYAKNCAACHQVRNAQGQFQMVDMAGEPRIKTRAVPLEEVGTDPQMIKNLGVLADPGLLRELLPSRLAKLTHVPRPALLQLAVQGVTRRAAEIEGHPLPATPSARIEPPLDGRGYKAGPLEGVWATAPYLHNGSVPNLYELLLPAEQRSGSFYVGSRRFDPRHVGFDKECSPGAFEYRVADEHGPIPGNSNAGHEGHGTCQNEGYTQTFENGRWREFTDSERWDLVEYLKAGTPCEKSAPAETAGLEQIPDGEADQIQNIVQLTIQQLKNRYADQTRVLRGVHAKDHGCVRATFAVAADLPEELRVGVFQPGRCYDAWIRFSNAATLVRPDSPLEGPDGQQVAVHGSRGMSIKLMGVQGTPILEPHGALTQDFLLVNHPVFAFANVEDYEVLSEVLADPANQERPDKFFPTQIAKGGAARDRALRTLEIVKRIRAASVAEGAYQPQPASPVDCRYFSAAPFLYGEGRVAKFAATPMDPPADPKPNTADPNFLRSALLARLECRPDAQPVVFHFQVQVRPAGELNIATDIEDVCTEWCEQQHPFVTVATITIAPQDFDSPQRRNQCESLFFTPWHSLQEHRPLGGINRMRRGVYEASSGFRHLPKEPAGW